MKGDTLSEKSASVAVYTFETHLRARALEQAGTIGLRARVYEIKIQILGDFSYAAHNHDMERPEFGPERPAVRTSSTSWSVPYKQALGSDVIALQEILDPNALQALANGLRSALHTQTS